MKGLVCSAEVCFGYRGYRLSHCRLKNATAKLRMYCTVENVLRRALALHGLTVKRAAGVRKVQRGISYPSVRMFRCWTECPKV